MYYNSNSKAGKKTIHKQSESMPCLSILHISQGWQIRGEKSFRPSLQTGAAQHPLLCTSPSPPLPLPPSSNDLIKTDLKQSLLPLTPQRCRCHSYAYAASLNECTGLTGVHVGNALQSSRCAPVHTDWDVGEERAAYLALNPPSLYSTLSARRFSFLCLSVSCLIPLYLLGAPV